MKYAIIIAMLAATGCRQVRITVIAHPDSTVMIDGTTLQADKPQEFELPGIKIPFLP